MEANTGKAELVKVIFGRSASRYDQSPFFPLCGRRLAELAAIEPGSRVLDIATGTGAVLLPAAEQAGPQGRVTGIDIAEEMVAQVSTAIRERRISNAEALTMDAQKLEFVDRSFDRITCGFALWFIPDVQAALREMRRVLRPNGRLAVSTWAPDALMREYNLLQSRYLPAPPELGSHVLTTSSAVTQALGKAGFEILFAADEEVSVVFPDEETWWSQRLTVPQLYADELSSEDRVRFKADVFAMLQAFRHPEGIRQTRGVVYAVAMPGA